MTNRHRTEPLEVTVSTPGAQVGGGTVVTLAGDTPNAVNSAEHPDRVVLAHTDLPTDGTRLRLHVPPCAVQTAVVQA